MKTFYNAHLPKMIIIIITLMASCSGTRHVNKNITSSSLKRKLDSVSFETTVDKTKSNISEIITERADTFAIIPGSTTTGSVRSGTIELKGGGSITFKNNRADSFTLVMPAKTVQFHYNKRTERKSEIDNDIVNRASVHVAKKEDIKNQAKVIKRTATLSFKLPWWLWILILLAMSCTGYYIYRKITNGAIFPLRLF